jgi:hypothetical protein
MSVESFNHREQRGLPVIMVAKTGLSGYRELGSALDHQSEPW